MAEDGWESAWTEALDALGLSDTRLLSSSCYDPGRRTYVRGGAVYKMVLTGSEASSARRAHDLRGEYEVLKSVSGLPGVPEALEWKKVGDAEFLSIVRLDGRPLNPESASLIEFSSALVRLAFIVLRLARKGVCHNDLCADNILVLKDGKVALIDFDQASKAGFIGCVVRSFAGIKFGGAKVHGSYGTLIKDYFKKKMSPGTLALLRKLAGKDIEGKHRIPDLPEGASAQLKSLHRAWKIAQTSDASSPGLKVAYYSYDFQGVHFPGERSWDDRWEVLRKITAYRGKRVLELGCNMSLLSCSLLKYEGAKDALCVDIDAMIIESAKLVSSALGVKPNYGQQDFDDPSDWESKLASFKPDIVFALNVLNWVKGKDRLMNFLGRFDEVIFEGHDSVETESARFRKVGFTNIRLITTTERKRPVLHCRK